MPSWPRHQGPDDTSDGVRACRVPQRLLVLFSCICISSLDARIIIRALSFSLQDIREHVASASEVNRSMAWLLHTLQDLLVLYWTSQPRSTLWVHQRHPAWRWCFWYLCSRPLSCIDPTGDSNGHSCPQVYFLAAAHMTGPSRALVDPSAEEHPAGHQKVPGVEMVLGRQPVTWLGQFRRRH